MESEIYLLESTLDEAETLDIGLFGEGQDIIEANNADSKILGHTDEWQTSVTDIQWGGAP